LNFFTKFKYNLGELAKELKIDYERLTGDVLISAGMIAYLGAFTAIYRQ
jgi:dynein heavy chain